MSIQCEKLVLRFGLRQGTDPMGGFGGHPDVNLPRGGALVPASAASWANLPSPRPGAGLSFMQVAQTHKFPARNAGDGPVQAIAIAADSPIDSVEMTIGSASEQTRHRISVGAPFIGTIPGDVDVLFAPSGAFPGIARPVALDPANVQSNRFDLTQVWWDCLAQADVQGGLLALLYPIRLVVYRGACAPTLGQTARGVYEANGEWEIVAVDGVPTPSIPAMCVLTAGRRRFRVSAGIYRAADAASAATLRIDGAIGRKNLGAGGSDLFDDRAWDPLLAGQALPIGVGSDDDCVVFDYNGAPYFAILPSITGGHIGTRGWWNVQAWDA